MKKYLPLLLLVFFIFVIAFATYRINSKQDLENIKAVQNDTVKIALPNFNLADLFKENQFFNNDTIKQKYSLINFFASWCTTCVAEHEILLRLSDEKIIDIYGVAFRDIDANTKNFLMQHNNPYTQVAKDSQGILAKQLNVEAVPETFLIDNKGNIIKRYQGNLQEFMIDEIKNIILKTN
jgi:cytochrome c biogenesis protein CcmG/thiol:disulfide interchange protein DsbE